MTLHSDKIKYLTKTFGESKLQNNGIELAVRCPKCGRPGKKKLCIRLDTDLYHCWVCNIKGKSLVRLLQKYKPHYLSEYISKFAKNNFNIYKQDPEIPNAKLPKDFKLVIENLWDPDALAVKKYANTRGISDAMLWRYRIGYSSQFGFRKRLIIPSFDNEGTLNYWVARSIFPDNPIRYINAKVPKTSIIFNEIDLDWTIPVTLVEGPFDMMKSPPNTTCLLGSSIQTTDKLFCEITLNNCEVLLCLDPDARIKQAEIADLLLSYDLIVNVVNIRTGDVGDMDPIDVTKIMSKPEVWHSNSSLFERINNL